MRINAIQVVGLLLVAAICALLVSLVLAGPWPLIAFLLVCLLGLTGRLRF